ncbi:hypothetical protein OIK40_11665 [Erythrobacter sp. sf7]|uniref:Nucleotide modification associated domain-containing protein n=2 Tax=Erythrobacter fulvus TaxID=2987523 RepID=A0ABT5JRC4_9SPHN|nr:hypothetical protein [Erythrobacter fulvus]
MQQSRWSDGWVMRIIFSRKGFDSAAGGGPSPIVEGRPISLPIPDTKGLSPVTYGDLGLGEHAARASRGRLGGGDACHFDPMFRADGTAILGQCHAAQGHLVKQGVREGDVFVFFGLFDSAEEGRHHRIFAYLRIMERIDLVTCDEPTRAHYRSLGQPHAFGLHANNDMLYVGRGAAASTAPASLRLTAPSAKPSQWIVPSWLRRTGLSCHDASWRWEEPGRLTAVSRGQEFVAHVGDDPEPREWLDRAIAAIEAG